MDESNGRGKSSLKGFEGMKSQERKRKAALERVRIEEEKIAEALVREEAAARSKMSEIQTLHQQSEDLRTSVISVLFSSFYF